MDGILFLHNQAGIQLARATEQIASLQGRVAELEAQLDAKKQPNKDSEVKP